MQDTFVDVKIMPYGINAKVTKGKNLLEVINKYNTDINPICGGNGKCGKCKVKLLKGSLSQIENDEKEMLKKEEIENNIVLACKRKILSNIEIKVISEDNDNLDKSYINNKTKNINPIIKKIHKKLELPTIKNQISDMDKILNLFDKNTYMNIEVLQTLHETLEESNYDITAVIMDNEIIKIEKYDTTNKNYSVVIDIGTTSVAGYLVDVVSSNVVDSISKYNPQKKYGSDVISRINYAINNKENLYELKKLVVNCIDSIIETLIKNSNVSKNNIYSIVMLGNTTMSHLLMGISVNGISKSPFTPAFTQSLKASVKLLGLNVLHESTKFVLLPNIAGYVGSDTLAVAISTDIDNKKGNFLVIDIGTNCELILKTNEKILTCSTAAGPAFEGANMECGIRAHSGAIYACYIDDDISLKTIDNKDPIGICGSGYIDLIANLRKIGVIKKQGRIEKLENLGFIPEKIKSRIKVENNKYKILLSEKNNVYLTQEDISNLQLAKGAVRAGIEIMLKEAKIENLDYILLAGAFGSNINKESLLDIKMIPNINKEKIISVGNAAGSGGIDILLNKELYLDMVNLQKKINHIELATNKDFNSIFAKSIIF